MEKYFHFHHVFFAAGLAVRNCTHFSSSAVSSSSFRTWASCRHPMTLCHPLILLTAALSFTGTCAAIKQKGMCNKMHIAWSERLITWEFSRGAARSGGHKGKKWKWTNAVARETWNTSEGVTIDLNYLHRKKPSVTWKQVWELFFFLGLQENVSPWMQPSLQPPRNKAVLTLC